MDLDNFEVAGKIRFAISITTRLKSRLMWNDKRHESSLIQSRSKSRLISGSDHMKAPNSEPFSEKVVIPRIVLPFNHVVFLWFQTFKDSLPIMKFHKIDLFSPLMTEFEVPDHFWSDKDAVTSSVKIFKIWVFWCICSPDQNFLSELFS